MNTQEQIKRNDKIISDLEQKRSDIFGFMAREMKGNPRITKALEDLSVINASLEKAYRADEELQKALEQENLQKAEEEAAQQAAAVQSGDSEDPNKACGEDDMQKAKDELRSEICECIRANKEFSDEYVKQLADKFKMEVDDVEDAIAEAIEANGGAND